MKRLGTAEAPPGEMGTGEIEVGEDRTGASVKLPVAVINGSNPGKTLYIQAASDGDEVNGVGVIQRVVDEIQPSTISGTILLCGIVNHYGFLVSSHRNPIDDRKINRTYPGSRTGSSSERIAAATFQAATKADLALDLHQGGTLRMIDEARIRCGQHHRLYGDCVELARAFGSRYILDQKGPKGQLARATVDNGIPTIDPELGGSVGWDDDSIETGVEGVFNVLKHYGFIKGNVAFPPQQRVNTLDHYFSPAGGLIRFHCDLGEDVEEGQLLYEVLGVFGGEKSRVRADSSGIFWRARRLPQAASGEYVCSLGVDPKPV